jgi:hypothetical protein
LLALAFSIDGKRLLADFEGEDSSDARTVRVPAGGARSC